MIRISYFNLYAEDYFLREKMKKKYMDDF